MATRTPKSARAAGARLERTVADYLAEHVDDRIDRRVKTGARDKGDLGGVRLHGQRVVIECKDEAKPKVSAALTEAEVERVNDGALAGVVVSKRHGKGQPGDQLVFMTLRDLAAMLSGVRPVEVEPMIGDAPVIEEAA